MSNNPIGIVGSRMEAYRRLNAIGIAAQRCNSGDPSRHFQDAMDTFRLFKAAMRMTLEALRAEGRRAPLEVARTLADRLTPIFAEELRAACVLSADEQAVLFEGYDQFVFDEVQIMLLGAHTRLCRTILELPLSMRNLAPEP